MIYVDIDSTHRNRIAYPNQANFDVLVHQEHLCCSSKNIVDYKSLASIIFPNPQQNEPIAFFTERLEPVYNSTKTMLNLPFMYSTSISPTIIQVDELPIYSTDPTSTTPLISIEYPRQSIPLGETNQFYKGDILENVSLREFRTIISSTYEDSQDYIFQSGVVLDVSTSDLTYIHVDAITINNIPFSNIDEFYVGKYIKFSNGFKSLILKYTTDKFSNAFAIRGQVDVNPGDTFTIVSDRRWFIEIDSPFSQNPPNYPCYRLPLPDFDFTFFQNVIYQSTNIVEKVDLSNQYSYNAVSFILNNNTTSTGGTPLGDVYYMASSNVDYTSWLPPVFVASNAYTGGNVGAGTTSTQVIRSEVQYINITSGLPDVWEPYFGSSTDVDTMGQDGWGVRAMYNPVPAASTYSSIMYTFQQDYTFASTQFYTYTVTLRIAGGIYSIESLTRLNFFEPTVVIKSLGNDSLQLLDIMIIDGLLRIYYTYSGRYYYRTATNIQATLFDVEVLLPMGIVYNSAYYGGRVIKLQHNEILNNTNTKVSVFLALETVSDAVSHLFLYNDTDAVLVNILSTSFPHTNPFFAGIILNSIKGARIEQLEINSVVTTVVLYWSEYGLFLTWNNNNIDAEDDWNTQITIDSRLIYDVDMIITGENIYSIQPKTGNLHIVYSRSDNAGGSELVSLHLNLNNNVSGNNSCMQYRIRRGIPHAYGVGEILDIDRNTMLLDINSSTFACKAIHLRLSNSIYASDSFYQINLFNFISSVDDNNIMYLQDVWPDITQYTLPPIGPTLLFLSMKDSTDLGRDFSGNGRNFTNTDVTYFNSYTDVDNITLYDVGFFSNNSRLEYPTLGVDRNADGIAINVDQYTFSVWFNLLSNATGTGSSAKCIAFFNDGLINLEITGDNTSTGNRLYIEIVLDNKLEATLDYIIELNTWYNVTIVMDSLPFVIYLNGELYTGPFSGTYTNTYERSKKIRVLGDEESFIGGRTSTSRDFDGYIKNVILTDIAWTPQQVLNNYNNALNIYYTLLEWEILGNIESQTQYLDIPIQNINESVCYDISLVQLTLPNVILSSGFGDRVAFYPYVYVLFLPNNKHYNTVIYSNNPVTKRGVLFKVPISDKSSPEISNFVNNYSTMIQRVKFNFNDSFHFAIYLSNGELFTTQQSDNLPPLEPNFFLQISATFGFKRSKD